MDESGAATRLHRIFGRPGSGPLSGIIVADFSRVLAGPYCTMLLADMGATVIKVESMQGDDTRGWIPPVRDDEATFDRSVNRNKHSIALDLNDAADRAVAHELAARADVQRRCCRRGGRVTPPSPACAPQAQRWSGARAMAP